MGFPRLFCALTLAFASAAFSQMPEDIMMQNHLQTVQKRYEERILQNCPDNFTLSRPGGPGWMARFWGADSADELTLGGPVANRFRYNSPILRDIAHSSNDYEAFEKTIQANVGYGPEDDLIFTRCYPELSKENFAKHSPSERAHYKQQIADFYYTMAKLDSCVSHALDGVATLERRLSPKGDKVLEGFVTKNPKEDVIPSYLHQSRERLLQIREDNKCEAGGKDLVAQDTKDTIAKLLEIDSLEGDLRNELSPEYKKEYIEGYVNEVMASRNNVETAQLNANLRSVDEVRQSAEENYYTSLEHNVALEGDAGLYAQKTQKMSEIPWLREETGIYGKLFDQGIDTHKALREQGLQSKTLGYSPYTLPFTLLPVSLKKKGPFANTNHVHLKPEAEELESEEFKERLEKILQKDFLKQKESLTNKANACIQATKCAIAGDNQKECRVALHAALENIKGNPAHEELKEAHIASTGQVKKDTHGNDMLDEKGELVLEGARSAEEISALEEPHFLTGLSPIREGYSKKLDEFETFVNQSIVDLTINSVIGGAGIAATGARLSATTIGLLERVGLRWGARLVEGGVSGLYHLGGKKSLATLTRAATQSGQMTKFKDLLRAAAETKFVQWAGKKGDSLNGFFLYGAKTAEARNSAFRLYQGAQLADLSWAGIVMGPMVVDSCMNAHKDQVEELALDEKGNPEKLCAAEWTQKLKIVEGSLMGCVFQGGMTGFMGLGGHMLLKRGFTAPGSNAAFKWDVADSATEMKFITKEERGKMLASFAEHGRKWHVENLRRSWRGTPETKGLDESVLDEVSKKFVSDVEAFGKKLGPKSQEDKLGRLLEFARSNPDVLASPNSRYSQLRNQNERLKLLAKWEESIDAFQNIAKASNNRGLIKYFADNPHVNNLIGRWIMQEGESSRNLEAILRKINTYKKYTPAQSQRALENYKQALLRAPTDGKKRSSDELADLLSLATNLRNGLDAIGEAPSSAHTNLLVELAVRDAFRAFEPRAARWAPTPGI